MVLYVVQCVCVCVCVCVCSHRPKSKNNNNNGDPPNTHTQKKKKFNDRPVSEYFKHNMQDRSMPWKSGVGGTK